MPDQRCLFMLSARGTAGGSRSARIAKWVTMLNMTSTPSPSSGLRHSLKQRHITMIALGGVIGAGLFVGSGVVIKAAGPAAVLSFVITGLLVVLVMRMLGEMAV